MSFGVIVLAAGKGVRMRDDRAKVLQVAAGRTLLHWVLSATSTLEPDEVAVVVGFDAEQVAAQLPEGVVPVLQEPQNGTGHAALVGLSGIAEVHDTIVVVPGDMPLIQAASLEALVAEREQSGAAAVILSVELDDPHGYGRILRSGGVVTAIVEERDGTHEERMIREVNTSVYAFDGRLLADALERIADHNDQGEYYLTDVIGILTRGGHTVTAHLTDQEEGFGVNSQAQLAEAAAVLRDRINTKLLDSGVWMLDPTRVYIDADVDVAPGARIFPDTYLTGATAVSAGARIGPSVQAHDSTIGEGATVLNAVLTGAVVGANAAVGPFAYLRPGAVLADGAKAGTYVEIKNSEVGEGSKVPHLSYIGDTTIGREVNVGAGTITVNYDGYTKSRTVIGDRAKIGSDTMLVAPVLIGDDASTGAGSVITQDVPDGALAVARSRQKIIPDYAQRRRMRDNKESD